MVTGLLVCNLLVALVAAAAALRAMRRSGRTPGAIVARFDGLERAAERVERTAREEGARGRDEASIAARDLREEVSDRLELVRDAVEVQLRNLQADNGRRLEEMRATVDEKLQSTLERRLTQSFRLVSERLEDVQRGLGEMQSLAVGVGDLRRMLGNVKTRGGWGEVQLGAILEQMLAPGQYEKNFRPRAGSAENVEFAVRMPGRKESEPCYLPIDAKFPTEDYQRLVAAHELGELRAIEEAGKALEQRVRGCAEDVGKKYVSPPLTTDFAIVFLPSEGLYAEVARRGELIAELQRRWRVLVVGPTNLAALLNSLQLGFRTLAVEQRSGEVMELLSAVKVEFGKFGDVLGKLKEKLAQAGETISSAEVRTRAIARRLKDVETLPAGRAQELLPSDEREPHADAATDCP